ncbi:MAG: hypothetical protein ABJ327_01900 [Litoreibacter sp.]
MTTLPAPQGSPAQQITHHLRMVLHHMDEAVEVAASEADMTRILGFLKELQKEIDA